MFSIFKKAKPKLLDLVPNKFSDIHSHVLPSIDDGAKDINDTEFLLNEMKKIGFGKIITTPHTMKYVWENNNDSIFNAKNLVYKNLNALANELTLQSASEYFLDDYFLEIVQQKNLLTLKDNYILVELSYTNPPINLFDILFEIQLCGYKPILAHPERYKYYHENFEVYKKLLKVGCVFQMNLLSSVGYYGKGVSQCADKLLKENMITYVGSDIHHENHIKSFDREIIIKNIKPFEAAFNNNSFFN